MQPQIDVIILYSLGLLIRFPILHSPAFGIPTDSDDETNCLHCETFFTWSAVLKVVTSMWSCKNAIYLLLGPGLAVAKGAKLLGAMFRGAALPAIYVLRSGTGKHKITC
jgi:hypothetical protein